MGASGRDVQLSEKALSLFNYGVECKSRARIAIYADYLQAGANAAPNVPLLVIKQNHSEPLAVVSLEHFMELLSDHQKNNQD
jgi:hypothetical protein